MKSDGTRHTLGDIFHERTEFDFMGRRWRWALISGVAILVGVLGFALRGGFNLGIDFEGGTAWQATAADGSPSAGEVRDTVRPFGLADAKVTILGSDSFRVQADELEAEERDRVTEALAEYAGVDATEVSVTDVGPTWGEQVSRKALRALVIFFLVIAGYLTLRFEWKMALAALLAVLHDIVITGGVYAVTGFEVAPATVIALLTILGFSLYDTVVVFDKVRENEPSVGLVRGDTYADMVNRSMNQVLMRSLNTSFVALLPVASLLVVGSWIMGAASLRDFALALFIGLLVGTYSSIFVATPILAWWKEREPRYRSLRERAAAREPVPAPAPVGAPQEAGPGGRRGAPEPPPAAPTGARAPRPRQPRRRKR